VWDEVVRQTGNEMGQREAKGSHSLGGLPGRLSFAVRLSANLALQPLAFRPGSGGFALPRRSLSGLRLLDS
jgi:hypothetical protein